MALRGLSIGSLTLRRVNFLVTVSQSAEYVKYAKIFSGYFWLIFIPTEDLGNPFLISW